jgi:hypothetical protein
MLNIIIQNKFIKVYIMKKYFALIILIFIINNCGGSKIIITEDKYMKIKTATLEIKHKVIEGKLQNGVVRYEKEIPRNLNKPVSVFFVFFSNPDSSFFVETALDDTAYVIINDKKYKVPVTEISSQNNISSGGFMVISVSRNWFVLTGKVKLTKEIETELLKSDKLIYRFTTSNKPSIVEVKPAELQKVKELITYPENK